MKLSGLHTAVLACPFMFGAAVVLGYPPPNRPCLDVCKHALQACLATANDAERPVCFQEHRECVDGCGLRAE